MKKEQNQVRDFMIKAEQATPSVPTILSPEVARLRVQLIAEELIEFSNSLGLRLEMVDDSRGLDDPTIHVHSADRPPDLVETYDAILDLLVVVIGAAVATGLEIDPGWKAVHVSNMAKFGPGGRKREDGKWLKPPDWQPPDLRSLVDSRNY